MQRRNFSELFWAIFFLALMAFLATYRMVRSFIDALFSEEGEAPTQSFAQINWPQWLVTGFFFLLIFLVLAIWLWRYQFKRKKPVKERALLGRLRRPSPQ